MAHVKKLAAAVVLATCVTPVTAQDWPGWRGPARDGHLTSFKAPATWPKTLAKKWSIKVGEGHSSPIIVGKRAFVLVRQGEEEITLCLDLETGKTLWQDKCPAPFNSVIFPAQRLGKAPRSTPLFHEGKLYILGINGTLSCLQSDSGSVLWRTDYAKMFPIAMPVCGASLSPIIEGKKLYLHAGHEDKGAFFALDKDTGKEIWRWDGEGPGYTSPVLTTIEGQRMIITASHNMWLGLNPENGKMLWSLKNRQNMFNHNSITPVVAGNQVICGANQRATFNLKLNRKGTEWSAEKVWETRDMTMSTSSPVITGGLVYSFNEKRRGQLAVMELASGKITWECPGNKGENCTIFDAGQVILAFDATGQMFAYKKTGNTLTEAAKYEVGDSTMWSSPAISGNKILVKGAQTLTLWEVPK